MQRDTYLTFKDIHETPDAMLRNAEEIYKHASREHVLPSGALDLRFLTYKEESTSDPVLYLTARGNNIGETNYVAVSYTWQRTDPVDDTVIVPKYKISTTSQFPAVCREPRSQNAVLHRAVQFARAYNVPFIWIDHDCIDQQDPSDVERHLDIVHEIFNQSRCAIGLLSFHIHSAIQMKVLRYIHGGVCLDGLQRPPGSQESELDVGQRLRQALRFLTTLSTDKWFSRTWTFMERLSARNMVLLLPCDPSLAMRSKIKGPPAEVELSLVQLQEAWKLFVETCRHGSIYNEMRSESQSARHEEGSDVEVFNQLNGLIRSKFLVGFRRPWHQEPSHWQVMTCFMQMEQCENTILSDRLLILGYLCGFSRRLKTTELNHYKYSYSTCILVLLLMNGWWLEFWGDNDASFCWNHTFRDLLTQRYSQDQPGDLGPLPPSQESVEVPFGQECVSDSFMERLRAIFGGEGAYIAKTPSVLNKKRDMLN